MVVGVGVGIRTEEVNEREESVLSEMRRMERRFGFGSEARRRRMRRKVSTRSSPFLFLRRWPWVDWERRVGGRMRRMMTRRSEDEKRKRRGTKAEGERMLSEQRRRRQLGW